MLQTISSILKKRTQLDNYTLGPSAGTAQFQLYLQNYMSACIKVVSPPAPKLVHEDITSFCGHLPRYD